jgi:hypothetical protein
MPTYSIEGPDKKTYSIEGPEGATREQVIAKIRERTAAQPAQRGVLDKLFGMSGPRYQTWPERAIRDVMGIPESMVKAAASAPPGSREATAAMAAPAAETALAASPMSPVSRLARTGLKAARATTPTQEELATVTTGAGQGYRGGVMDVPLKDHVLPEIQANILDHLHTEHYRDYGAPFVFRAVKELEPVKGKIPTVADIETVRQILSKAPFDQRAAAATARNKINEYLSEIQPTDTALGEDVGTILGNIRGNYAALKRSELITEGVEKAGRGAQSSGMGANLDNKLRQMVKAIRDNPKLNRGFNEAELKQMDKIIKGGRLTNLARLFSRFGPEHPLTGWGMAGIEGIKHGALLPLVTLGGGHIAQKIAEGSTKKHIQALDEAVRQRSPLFQQQGQKRPPLSIANRADLSALLRGLLEAGPPTDVQTYLNKSGM